MIRSWRYTKNAGNAAIYLRAKNAGQYWNFSTLAWVVAEAAATKAFFTEYADAGDAEESDFEVSFTAPPLGPWKVEVVEASTGLTIAKGSTEDVATTVLASAALDSTVAKEATLATVASYVDTEITTLLDRLGAFTGTGVNTVLGFFKALLSKTATLPTDIGGTFTPVTDSTEALAETMTAVGGLTGAHQVTLQFYETATVIPIADVSIDVYDSTNTARMNGSSIKTDSNGQATFNRDNGIYKIRAMLAGVTFTLGTVTVAGADVTQILYGTPITADAPPAAGAIRVYEFCFKQDGVTPMETADVKATAKIIDLPYDYNGRWHSGQNISGTYNVSTGKVYWDLAPGAFVEFNIRNVLNAERQRHVPMTAVGDTIRLAEIAS